MRRVLEKSTSLESLCVCFYQFLFSVKTLIEKKVYNEVDQIVKRNFTVLLLSKMFFIFGVSPIMSCVLLDLALCCPSLAILWELEVRAWGEMEKHKPVSSLFASACPLLTTAPLYVPLSLSPSLFFSFSQHNLQRPPLSMSTSLDGSIMACWGSLVLAGGAAGSASYFTHPHHPPSFLQSLAKTISAHSLGADPVPPAWDTMPNPLGSGVSGTQTTPSNPAN